MFKFSRILIIYAIAAPLALGLGYLVTTPDQLTFVAIGLLLFLFSLPLLLRWHHFLLIVFWNSIFFFPFLPGQPQYWLVFALLSFVISFLNHIMFQKHFLRAPEFTRAVLFLTTVILVTAYVRGGIGMRAFGGASYGGKKYLYIFITVMGYYALTAEQVPLAKSGKMAGLYFISGVSNALSNLAYTLGSGAYFLYFFVPAGLASIQYFSDIGQTDIDRIAGLGAASSATLCFLLARYGIRGLFDFGRPWRFALLLLTIVACSFAGFRSTLMLLGLILAFQFYYEGLFHTHFLPILVGLAVCGIIPIVFFVDKMPPPVQRTLSFLPINVNPEIRDNAKGSTEWRVEMWGALIKQLPKYLLIGKGYNIDPNELTGSIEEAQSGTASSGFEGAMIAGDYHSGPFSLIIPFGIFGVIGFLWVLYAGYKVLSLNRRFGDAKLRRINTVLLSTYLAYVVSYFFIFGDFDSELNVFLGAVGMSVSLNGGVRRRSVRMRQPVAAPQPLPLEPGQVTV